MSDDQSSPDRASRASAKPWLRFVGMGTELATFTLTTTLLGYWIDSHRQHKTPYCTAAGALIGFVCGMIRFITQAMKSVSGDVLDEAKRHEETDPPKQNLP